MTVEFKRQFSASELGYKLGHLFAGITDIDRASEILYPTNTVDREAFFIEGAKAYEVYHAVQEETSKGIQDILLGMGK